MHKTLLTFLLIFSLVIASCSLFERKEYIPAYLHVSEHHLTTEPTEGSNSHNICDAWVYVNNNHVGVFELPFTIPILESGLHTIRIEPGIKNNGVDAYRVIYPMLHDYTIDTVLTEMGILTLNPVFKYRPNVVKLNEDFDGIGSIFEASATSDTSLMIISGESAYEGRSMAVYLDDVRKNFECRSNELYELPKNTPVYLEINYRNTDAFVFGLFAREYSGFDMIEKRVPVYTFNPSPDEWKKVYIELNYHLNPSSQFNEFRLYFTCIRPDNPYSDKTEIYIDNIKILHF